MPTLQPIAAIYGNLAAVLIHWNHRSLECSGSGSTGGVCLTTEILRGIRDGHNCSSGRRSGQQEGSGGNNSNPQRQRHCISGSGSSMSGGNISSEHHESTSSVPTHYAIHTRSTATYDMDNKHRHLHTVLQQEQQQAGAQATAAAGPGATAARWLLEHGFLTPTVGDIEHQNHLKTTSAPKAHRTPLHRHCASHVFRNPKNTISRFG